MSSQRQTGRTLVVALRSMILATVVLGIAYPLVITGIGQLAIPWQANGSEVQVDGKTVGSALIGQSFTDKKGNPLPQWFQSRPSAAGDGYDGGASSGSNYGPENPTLIKDIAKRKAQIAAFNGVSPDRVPADAVTASSSGLDPHISPEYALIQITRVAEARGLPEGSVRTLVTSAIQQRDLGYLGEPIVNVLKLNIALQQLGG